MAASITEKLNCRLVSIIGAVTVAVGLISTSFAESIIIYYFTYSLIVGFGTCCIRTSTFLVVAQYFHRQKPFATGMLTAGAGMGMFLLAPLIQTLLDNFGLHNTFRFLAGIVFVSGFSALVYDPNVEEIDPKDSATLELDDENNETGSKMKIVDCSVWRVPIFTVFSLVYMLNCAGTYFLVIHLVSYYHLLWVYKVVRVFSSMRLRKRQDASLLTKNLLNQLFYRLSHCCFQVHVNVVNVLRLNNEIRRARS